MDNQSNQNSESQLMNSNMVPSQNPGPNPDPNNFGQPQNFQQPVYQQPMMQQQVQQPQQQMPKKRGYFNVKRSGKGMWLFIAATLLVLMVVPVIGALSNRSATSDDTIESTSTKQPAVRDSKKSKSSKNDSTSDNSSDSDSAETSSDSAAGGTTVEFPTNTTLYSFASQNNTSVDQLMILNPGLNASNYSSYWGQKVAVK